MSGFTGHDLTCVRADRVVFHGLGFAVQPGGALLLRGPNGSGKSSLLHLMAGLLRPVAGFIRWDGVPIHDDPEAYHRRISYLGHLDAVKPALTVHETVEFWTAVAGGDAAATARALETVGLAELSDMPARLLSAGQRRRLALARVFAVPRAIWLLDEPATGLDEPATVVLRDAIETHRADGGVVVIATHADLGLRDAAVLQPGEFAPDRPYAWSA